MRCNALNSSQGSGRPSPSPLLNSSTGHVFNSWLLSSCRHRQQMSQLTGPPGPCFDTLGTPQAIYDLGVPGLKHYIRSIGLFNTKAQNIIKTCSILIEKYSGRVPNDRAALEALPGVGRKTANVVLNTAFGEPTIAVDTHIYRVSNRTGLAKVGRYWPSKKLCCGQRQSAT